MIKVRLLSACLLFLQTGLFSQAAHPSLRRGDEAFAKKEYTTAKQHYQEAVGQEPGNANAIYNLGCVEYQQGKYPEAEKSFEQSVAGTQLPGPKADGLYNLGNARLKQRKYREAIEAYENSLRLRPGDAAAKQNLQMAKEKLRQEKEEEQKKQQKQNQDPGQQPPAPQQPPGDQPPSPQDKPKQDPGKQPQNPGENPGPDQSGSSAPQTGKMTRQEAQRLLETTIGPEDRKSARKYRASVRKSLPKDQQKDW